MVEIICKINGEKGMITRVETYECTKNGRDYLAPPYAIIKWDNPKKGQQIKTNAQIPYLLQMEKRGAIKITNLEELLKACETPEMYHSPWE